MRLFPRSLKLSRIRCGLAWLLLAAVGAAQEPFQPRWVALDEPLDEKATGEKATDLPVELLDDPPANDPPANDPPANDPPVWAPPPMEPSPIEQQLGVQWEGLDRRFQLLPQGFLYPAYLAGRKESRLSAFMTRITDERWTWDADLGGRFGLFRYGSGDALRPRGWQLDLEASVQAQLDLSDQVDLRAADYRVRLWLLQILVLKLDTSQFGLNFD